MDQKHLNKPASLIGDHHLPTLLSWLESLSPGLRQEAQEFALFGAVSTGWAKATDRLLHGELGKEVLADCWSMGSPSTRPTAMVPSPLGAPSVPPMRK